MTTYFVALWRKACGYLNAACARVASGISVAYEPMDKPEEDAVAGTKKLSRLTVPARTV